MKGASPSIAAYWANAQITALRVAGTLAMKTVDSAIGRTMNLAVSLRSQEDLVDWSMLPQDLRDKATEALEAAQLAGIDFGNPLLALPVAGTRVE